MAEARFKFERLDVWKMALNYHDLIYAIAEQLPRSEEYNVKSQIIRAATSIALNIAEGSTCQTDAEQARFLSMSIRSLIETIACLRIIERRGYLNGLETLRKTDLEAERLLSRLIAFRNRPMAFLRSQARRLKPLQQLQSRPSAAGMLDFSLRRQAL
jgi:four helix bundle protein